MGRAALTQGRLFHLGPRPAGGGPLPDGDVAVSQLRAHGEVGALKGPTGWIPKYDDLKPLFQQVLGKDYSHDDYVAQFTIRIPECLAKLDRMLRKTVGGRLFEKLSRFWMI